ncbi:meiosis-specific nuclear structural protein 1-like [Schistocerca cancellata]|uniref:meiosis-specific nuclear structural protein 1-like n=1 Tax=Schistocerca cancellata TaxID=274614 RepID=UPI0021188189|nr:meiosis-specific nuclear structural protein 1-like [Schistocerca cancellata]
MSFATKHLQEQRRLKEVSALQTMAQLEAIEAERMKMDLRAEGRQTLQKLRVAKWEAEKEERIGKPKSLQRELLFNQLRQDEVLAEEMDKAKRREIVQLKLRQQLRESSVELKELESKLRAAYVYKELCAQKAEKEAEKMREKMYANEEREALQRMKRQDEEMELKKQEEEAKRQIEYRHQLQDQMIEAYNRREAAFIEFLQEKQMIDEAVRRIHDEDTREFEQKMLMMKKTKKEMDDFKKARDEWRKKEMESVEMENRRLVEFLQKREEREKERMQQLKEKEEKKARVKESLSRKLFEEDLMRLERTDLLQQLAEEDLRQAALRREQEDVDRALRTRLDLQDTMRQQARDKAERLRKEAEEEDRYRQQLTREIMEKQRIDQLTAERQRVRRAELRREVEEMIAERRRKRQAELQELHEQEQWLQRLDDDRRRRIEEERLRMLKEHASRLIGFMPPGVLREDDLPHLGPELAKMYKEQAIC